MIGLDTNILVRYLVQDDPKQSQKVNKLMTEIERSGEKLWVCQITLCESIWVLESCYKKSKKEIAELLQYLVEIEQVELESEEAVSEALQDYQKHQNIDFSDCLIGRQNLFKFCQYTY